MYLANCRAEAKKTNVLGNTRQGAKHRHELIIVVLASVPLWLDQWLQPSLCFASAGMPFIATWVNPHAACGMEPGGAVTLVRNEEPGGDVTLLHIAADDGQQANAFALVSMVPLRMIVDVPIRSENCTLVFAAFVVEALILRLLRGWNFHA